MTHSKRIHRVAISLDDRALCDLSLLASIDRKDLSGYVYDLLVDHLYGHANRLQPTPECEQQKRCRGE